MTIGEDQKASRGHYVWMPAKAGERGGSALGSVTWRLNVAKAGTYYAWGRVEAPTPENDSFYVRLFTETADLVGMATWPTGTHEQWTWTPMRIDAAQGPTPLPLEGEVSLQLRVREAGTKIDRLFITADPKRRPE
jgi:hypothetical protein